MLNPLQRYKSISVLVLDDFSEFRLSLKQIVESFGASHVDVCANAQEAMALYGEHKHDLVLVDYNLGQGLNGLQLLAELNHRNLLKYGTCYVLITGETALDLVMGALEYRPDDYLAKPFTKTTLKSRLDRLVDKNLAFKPIYQALNSEKPNKALELCDLLMAKNKRVAIVCMRLKAEIYLKQLKYRNALSIYNSIIDSRELSWAQMGAATCLLALSQSDKALDLCKLIITKNPNAVEAHDLASECLIQQQDYEAAYVMIQDAAHRSPNSIVRQRQLALLACRYHDMEIAFSAYKKVLELAKFSCLSQIEDYLNHLIICTQFQLSGHITGTKRAIKEYSEIYRALNKFYPGKQSQLIVEIHQAFTAYLKSHNLNAMTHAAQKIVSYPDPLNIVFIKLLDLITNDEDLSPIKKILENTITETKADMVAHDDQQKSECFNRLGMLKYQEKDFESAQNALATALANAQHNPNIALNLLQSSYQLFNKSQRFTLTKRQLVLSVQALKGLAP